MTDPAESPTVSETTPLVTSKTIETSLTVENGVKVSGQFNGKIEDEKPGLLTIFTGRRKYTLILITLAQFLSGVAFSLLGPFFPSEALKKGMSMGMVGIVSGSFEIVVFLTAPIYGNYLVKLGPRFVFIAGIFMGGTCNILFGTLQYCPNGTPFVVMTLLVRIVEALGFSGFITSSFAIVSSEFKENVGLTFGILETGAGLGFMLGPTIGGGLYMLGGFGVPFYIAGVAVLLNAVAVYSFLPLVEELPKKRKKSLLTMIRNPMIAFPCLSVFCGNVGITSYDTLFSNHLTPMHISVGIIGVIYGLVALVYSVMSSIWGYISDTKNIQAPLIIGGHFIFGIGFLLIGPSNLLPFLSYNLVTILIGLACIGFSFGCTLIPTMKCMIIGATEMGLENNMDTFALVSGLFNSVYTLGGFVGPVGGGYLVQKFDYPIAYTVIGMFSFFVMVVSTVHFTYRRLRRRNTYPSVENVESNRRLSSQSYEEPVGRQRSGSVFIRSARLPSMSGTAGSF